MEHVKIQINTGEALKRLLGDDPALHVTLKDRVVDAIIEEHLRPLLTPEWHNKILGEIQVAIDKVKANYTTKVMVESGWGQGLTLSADIKTKINEHIASNIDKLVGDKIKIEREFIADRLKNILEKNRHNIEKYIAAQLDLQINTAVNAQLKNITGHITELSKFYQSEKAALAAGDKPRKIELEL